MRENAASGGLPVQTIIRQMERADLPGVARLERECFTVPWSEALLGGCLDNGYDRSWVLEVKHTLPPGEEVAAYCNFRMIAGEGELMRIAVAKPYRGRGYARDLMEILVRYARENKVTAVTLEVRASNLSAVTLYKDYGFQIEAVRRGYYTNPAEDALIMWKRHV